MAQKINQTSIIIFSVDVIGPNQKHTRVFLKIPLNTNQQNPAKIPILLLWKIYYEVKSKISSTLVQLTVHFFNETKWTETTFEELEKKELFEQFE